ncbi:MAG: histidine phosphatase family protein [Planctomycetota bacterium]|nr:histidine phosphatase family protein [Planctomycetota bacterium]
MRLFLIRHGEVEPTRQGSFYGGSEVPLSALGEQEARRAALFIADQELDYVISSPLSRACFGAEQLLKGRSTAIPWVRDNSFLEINRGDWVGLTPEEVEIKAPGQLAAHQQDPANWRGHHGESLGDLRIRVISGLERIRALGDELSVALVSHLFPTRAILAEVLGLPLTQWNQIEIPTASISLVEFAADGMSKVIYQGHKPE